VHVTIFEYRLRDDADIDAYNELSERMHAIVDGDPSYGHLASQTLQRDDGSRVALEWFESGDGVRRWAANPQHREAQRRGRDEFYAWYRVRTCAVERDMQFGETALT
jgi:heme-degrading monooxygenase HmoA